MLWLRLRLRPWRLDMWLWRRGGTRRFRRRCDAARFDDRRRRCDALWLRRGRRRGDVRGRRYDVLRHRRFHALPWRHEGPGGLGFRALRFRALRFRTLGFRALGFRALGFRTLGPGAGRRSRRGTRCRRRDRPR